MPYVARGDMENMKYRIHELESERSNPWAALRPAALKHLAEALEDYDAASPKGRLRTQIKVEIERRGIK
jgi:hypothetical protein